MLRLWLPLLFVVACRRAPSEAVPRPGETRVVLAGTALGIVLPSGIAIREDDPEVTGAPTTHEELADGFAAFQAPRRITTAAHATSWFLTTQPGAETPTTLEDATRLALEADPGQPRRRMLGREVLPGGGFLVSTASADRLTVHVWRPGPPAFQCGGEDFRDESFVPAPSWLDDPAAVEAARVALEAPCRTARTLR